MAIGIHIANIGIFNIDASGIILKKDDSSVTIKQQLTASMEHLIIEDASIPNSSGYPTVKQYLEDEAADDYVLSHIDQNKVITYLRNSSGGYPTP